MISLQQTWQNQPDQSGFVESPTSIDQFGFTTSESPTPYPFLLRKMIKKTKRKRDVSKIKKENKRVEKWLKILPKYHATITKNPDKSMLVCVK